MSQHEDSEKKGSFYEDNELQIVNSNTQLNENVDDCPHCPYCSSDEGAFGWYQDGDWYCTACERFFKGCPNCFRLMMALPAGPADDEELNKLMKNERGDSDRHKFEIRLSRIYERLQTHAHWNAPSQAERRDFHQCAQIRYTRFVNQLVAYVLRGPASIVTEYALGSAPGFWHFAFLEDGCQPYTAKYKMYWACDFCLETHYSWCVG